jgi:hypothetical protein
MNKRELVDHIRSGPPELNLQKAFRFRRRTRSNPCDFNEFLQALRSSETIRDVTCWSQLQLGIAEDEWVLLVKTLGSIRDIQNLTLYCTPGSRDFHPFQAVADTVNKAQSLCQLVIYPYAASLPSDPFGMIALANALRGHTSLQAFGWFDWNALGAAQGLSLDPVLRALPACPHLWKVDIMTECASADAMKNLLQLQSATDLLLVLNKDHWLVVADKIRQGRCNVQRLNLSMVQATRSEATEAVKAVASAIRSDQNLNHLTLQMEAGFTDEAGVALAEALTVNKSLNDICLSVLPLHVSLRVDNRPTFGAQSYKAFAAMLRVNTSLVLELPEFETAGADERLLESQKQMIIEQRLNKVGRGRLLASRQTRREEWVDALHELNSDNIDNSSAFQVSCLYSLLRSNPSELFACPN